MVIALYSCALRHLAKHSVDGQSASDARADTWSKHLCPCSEDKERPRLIQVDTKFDTNQVMQCWYYLNVQKFMNAFDTNRPRKWDSWPCDFEEERNMDIYVVIYSVKSELWQKETRWVVKV